MEGYISETVDLFRQLAIFQGLDDAQLAEVESFFQRVKVRKGDLVVQEGTPGDFFYVIFSGRLQVWHETPQGPQEVATLIRGDYFGEEALLFRQPRIANVSAVEDSELLLVDQEGFQQMLDRYPRLRISFAVTAESRHLAEKEHFDWLGKDEAVYLITRKHELFLWRSLILPILVVLLGIPFAVWGAVQSSVFFRDVLLVVGGFSIGGGVLWGIWNWIDWGNDYYIITNQRVVWLENVIGIYSSRR
ncbi:MAG: cyclic nucleotide-binding domain-containing protein, partial [Anaerolineales bacterium]|nr:cyclic nucleotide-binding domain-containing protein [Anaerolineales bacterium]